MKIEIDILDESVPDTIAAIGAIVPIIEEGVAAEDYIANFIGLYLDERVLSYKMSQAVAAITASKTSVLTSKKQL